MHVRHSVRAPMGGLEKSAPSARHWGKTGVSTSYVMGDQMTDYEQVLETARRLPAADRDRLARALSGGAAAPAGLAPLAMAGRAAPQSVAWLKAERGHAVLATDTGPADADLPAGAEAIAGMWADAREAGV